MQLLDPLEVDDGDDADLEIGVFCDVDAVGDDRAVQAFVEQEIGRRQRLPRRERAGLFSVKLRFLVVVNIVAGQPLPGRAEFGKQGLEPIEQIRFGEKWLKCLLPRSACAAISARIPARS